MAVYRSGKPAAPVFAQSMADREAERALRAEVVQAFSPARLKAMVMLASKGALAWCKPDPGETFIRDDDRPFADLPFYAECLVDEFRILVHVRLGLRDPAEACHVLPIDDVLSVARPLKRGMGGVPPMVTNAVDCPDSIRGRDIGTLQN
jgi:hypothetical protein